MRHIKFTPWVGNNYLRAPFGKRILILGESHYQPKGHDSINDSTGYTNIVIREQLDGSYTKSFWTHIAVTFLNKSPSLDDKREFWHGVSFCNYVQQSVGVGARVRPSSDMFEASAPAFFELLESLRPQVMVVLGYELWRNLPKAFSDEQTIETHAGPINTRSYSYSDGTSIACSIKHPSSGFNGRTWHPRVMSIICN